VVKFINGEFGNEMWVADDRVEEYKAVGHKPAASDTEKPAEEKPKAKKKTTKK
jgi:hypothetical protein